MIENVSFQSNYQMEQKFLQLTLFSLKIGRRDIDFSYFYFIFFLIMSFSISIEIVCIKKKVLFGWNLFSGTK